MSASQKLAELVVDAREILDDQALDKEVRAVLCNGILLIDIAHYMQNKRERSDGNNQPTG